MELKLRKARRLEGKIQTHLSTQPLDGTAAIRVLGTLEEAKTSSSGARERYLAEYARREALIRLRYRIRRAIEACNEQSGINLLINEKVALQQLLNETTVPSTAVPFSETDLSDLWRTHQKDSPDGLGFHVRDNYKFTVSLIDQRTREQFLERRAALKRQIEKLEDELGHLNASKSITLSESDEKLLEMLHLL
jgi:hypothetical protein